MSLIHIKGPQWPVWGGWLVKNIQHFARDGRAQADRAGSPDDARGDSGVAGWFDGGASARHRGDSGINQAVIQRNPDPYVFYE
jgi:hypothetical protein